MDQPIVTQVEFTLPIGLQDESGTLHRHGVMRLATAADEIFPLRDYRVQSNPAYLSVIVMSRVIVKLGTSDVISTSMIENLYSRDFNFLQDLYNKINGLGDEGSASQAAADRAGSYEGNVEALPLRTSFTQR